MINFTGCFANIFLPQIDVNNTTLGDMVTRVIKAKLGFNEPSIMMGSCFLYEEGTFKCWV